MSADNGGPAFPFEDSHPASEGMTLRDYFAAKAMQGMFANANESWSYEAVADMAYRTADEMLKARAR